MAGRLHASHSDSTVQDLMYSKVQIVQVPTGEMEGVVHGE